MADLETSAPEVVNGGSHDFRLLLSSSARDFLVRNSGDQVNVDSLKGKKLGLYFSASWCPPCRGFTPKLVEVYEELSSKGDFEVIFIPSDRDADAFNSYFSKMPWLAIPFSDSETHGRLKKLFKVSGIPHLVILDEEGKVSTEDGVEIIQEYGVDGYPFSVEKIKELKEQEEKARREQSLRSILVSPSCDFVIASDGNQVPVSELEGKTVGLYFAVSSFPPSVEFTEQLVEAYNELKEQGESFEIVLISLDDEEKSFKQSFGDMPWLSLPFKDKRCEKLRRYFELRTVPTLVIIGPDGKTLHPNVAEAIEEHGIQAYPFTPEKLAELAEIEKAKKAAQTLESILVSGDLNFVIGKDGAKVPVSELEGKTVGLYLAVASFPPSVKFTQKLVEAYNKLKEQGESFEIVLISLDDEEESFKQSFGDMPWLSLPFKDKRCKKLVRYFELGTVPTLVIIGPDGKTLHPNVAEAIEEHGIQAYPFTPEKFAELAEIEKAKEAAQTLESILVSGDLNFVIGKDGAKIPVSDLVGKNILLYFSAHWCGPCRAFLPKLIEAYQKIKAKDEAFEVIFISSDRDQTSFDDFFSEMPWLALPFGDDRKALLSNKFKVRGIPNVVAIGSSGRTVSKDARNLIMMHGADAYPFTEERLKEIEAEYEEMAKGWPEKVKHPLHEEHELILSRRRVFNCDGCEEAGHVWSYYCKECDFDLHPKCALEQDKGAEGDAKKEEKPNEGLVCDGEVCKRV